MNGYVKGPIAYDIVVQQVAEPMGCITRGIDSRMGKVISLSILGWSMLSGRGPCHFKMVIDGWWQVRGRPPWGVCVCVYALPSGVLGEGTEALEALGHLT